VSKSDHRKGNLMNAQILEHKTSTATPGQQAVLNGLRDACTSMMMLRPDHPAPNLSPGALIAWYTGMLSAAIDTLAARPDLYAPGDQYPPPAVTGYTVGLATLLHARPRTGMAYRLNTYKALIHPSESFASPDSATRAIQQAVTAAARMLLITDDNATPPGVLAAEFRRAKATLIAAARNAGDVVRAHDDWNTAADPTD
jgi:hypothetical protein